MKNINYYINIYNSNNKAQFDRIVYILDNQVLMSDIKTIPNNLVKFDISRNNKTLRLKKFTKKNKLELSKNSQVLCSKKYFDSKCNILNKKYCYNKGEVIEWLLYKLIHKRYKRNNTPFYKDSDIVINNISYQVKYENATLASLSTLDKLASE